MVKIERSVTINLPVSQVFAFAGTGYGRNLPRWTSNIQEFEETSPGPMEAGVTFRQVRVIRGKPEESTMRITSFEKNRSFSFEDSGVLQAKGSYTFEPNGEGTTVTYVLDVQPGGFGRLAAPMIAREVGSNMETDLNKLKGIIESF